MTRGSPGDVIGTSSAGRGMKWGDVCGANECSADAEHSIDPSLSLKQTASGYPRTEMLEIPERSSIMWPVKKARISRRDEL